MSECRALLIEGHRQTIRLVFPDDLQQRGRKSIDRIGLETFGIVECR